MFGRFVENDFFVLPRMDGRDDGDWLNELWRVSCRRLGRGSFVGVLNEGRLSVKDRVDRPWVKFEVVVEG